MRLSPEGAAKRLSISLERLLHWESGEERPTMAQLRKMAEVYNALWLFSILRRFQKHSM